MERKRESAAALECTGQLEMQRTASGAAAETVEERWKFENSVDIAVASSSVVVNGSTSDAAAGPQRNEIPKNIT